MKEIIYSLISRDNQYNGLSQYSNFLPAPLISFFDHANMEEDLELWWKLYNTDVGTHKHKNMSFKVLFKNDFLYFNTFHGTKSINFYSQEIKKGNFELWREKNIFPFGDAGPYHFWCIGIASHNWGFIYYGHVEGEEVILIAERFDIFLEMFVFGYSNFDTNDF